MEVVTYFNTTHLLSYLHGSIYLLIKPLRQACLDSMEVVKLLFRPLQAELAAPWQNDQGENGLGWHTHYEYVVFASVHLRNVVKKRSSVQACLR